MRHLGIASVSGEVTETDYTEIISATNNEKEIQDSSWNDPNVFSMKKSFLNVVTNYKPKHKINFRELINEETVEDSDFVLPIEAILSAQSKFANSLVGYFVGKTIAFQLVKNYVTNTWAKFGFQKVIKDDDGFFFFKFTSTTGLEQVLEQGPWMIRNTPIILTKWSPNMTLTKDKVTKVPVWVKMHKVPIMCADPWGRLGFARALIQWKSPLFLECHVFGHPPSQCPKRIIQPVKDTTRANKNEFTTVTNRKNKGKAQATGNSNINEGLKMTKPNVRVVWQKEDFTNNDVVEGISGVKDNTIIDPDPNGSDSESEVEEMLMEPDPRAIKPNRYVERRKLWNELGSHKHMVRRLPWILIGDFNVALNMEDYHSGSSSISLEMIEFKDFVSNIEVLESWVILSFVIRFQERLLYFNLTEYRTTLMRFLKSQRLSSRHIPAETGLGDQAFDTPQRIVSELMDLRYQKLLGFPLN
ncbi:retrovirus-related pol polyprotein from transposon TNT 1-94 [Tanacetum coccineum]